MGTRGVLKNLHCNDKSLVGLPRLLDDLSVLLESKESADVIFLVGREEIPIYAHKLILMARCKSFQNVKRGEVCKILGSTVNPALTGSPVQVRLPQAQAECFREVMLFVYTGRLVLEDNAVFEMLAISQELGIEDLKMFCEDHITSTLKIHNACTFLASAMEMQDRLIGGKNGRSFIDRCVAYIGENAGECIKTNAFLNLPKDTLIRLISSDCLALEEEDVWRAVINWSKFQAGVTQPTAHWNEEERARICQGILSFMQGTVKIMEDLKYYCNLQLSGVINHVRLLLIDSQVFAEEVEPTGAVPMELSLERYRFAALPNKFHETEDKRVQPRMSLKLFQGSQILSGEKLDFQRLINSWCGFQKQQWRLLYKAAMHGFTADAFHRNCDGHSPTIVLVLGVQGSLCGGFTDIAWSSTSPKGRYVASDKSFLFTLVNNSDVRPAKFDVVKKMFAVSHHPKFGPIFGAGADLCIANMCNTSMDSYSNLPHSYDGDGASSGLLMGDYNFNVLDYEVFTTYNR